MDSRYRNLGIIVVIIVVVAVAFFLVPQEAVPGPGSQPTQATISFDSGYAEIKGIWTDVGLSDSYMSLNDLEFVDLMTEGQIASLEENLDNYGSEIAGKNPAVESLTDIYLDSAKLFSEYKSLAVSLDAEPVLETSELCDYLPKLYSNKDKSVDYINSAIDLSEEIEEFKKDYSAEAEKINLAASALNKGELNQAKSDLEQTVTEIQTFCGA